MTENKVVTDPITISQDLASRLQGSFALLHAFHYAIREQLFDRELGDSKCHFILLRKIESLEKRAKAILYHKARTFDLVRQINFSGIPIGQQFQLRIEPLEFEYDAFLYAVRSFLDILATTTEVIFWRKPQSGSIKNLEAELHSAPKDAKEAAIKMVALFGVKELKDHLNLHLSLDGKWSRRDTVAHSYHLEYSPCSYGIDAEGNRWWSCPIEGGIDLWQFTDDAIEFTHILIEQWTPILQEFYIRTESRQPMSLTPEERDIMRDNLFKTLKRSVMFSLEGPISAPFQITVGMLQEDPGLKK